jgi:hypothetical protein
MAMIICRRHGALIAATVCAHIADVVWGRSIDPSVRAASRVRVWFRGELHWGIDLCLACATAHGVGSGWIRLDDDGSPGGLLDQLYALLKPVCPECYAEWLDQTEGERDGSQ